MTTPNDSLDFYPTPDSLAFDMVFSLREVKIRGSPPTRNPSLSRPPVMERLRVRSTLWRSTSTTTIRPARLTATTRKRHEAQSLTASSFPATSAPC